MWQTFNKTPFPALGLPIRNAQGVEYWAVALRATFDLTPGERPRIAPAQDPVRIAPDFVAQGAVMSLREDADFAPFRPLTDVTLHGTAHPPDGPGVASYPVTLRVGAMQRRLIVHGPRTLVFGRLFDTVELSGHAGSVPLDWASATGGADRFPDTDADPLLHDDNPLGTGWFANRRRVPAGARMALAPLALPDEPADARTPARPAAFCAVAPHWGPRRRWAGTFDTQWQATRHPLLPQDFDLRFHQAAPAEQQIALEGREVVHIEGCGAVLHFELPRVVAEARTTIAGRVVASRFRLVSVAIQTDQRKLRMVWNSCVPCPGQDGQIESTLVRLRLLSGVAGGDAVRAAPMAPA